mgnify:CR=1 FL=1
MVFMKEKICTKSVIYNASIVLCIVYFIHKKSHLDPEWCKEKLPWHYDHHMGKNQNTNWCVVHPLADYLMGTRKKYEYK